MKHYLKHFLFVISVILAKTTYAQDSAAVCKVLSETLNTSYTGDCKKGLAHGKGEAKGLYRYVGNFKNGRPNGKGIMYYGENFFDGNFQDGLREGKGEMHFINNGVDSIVKGYWSGDEYRGKSYKTYQLTGTNDFDRVEVTPSSESGNKITIEISTTSSDAPHAGTGARPSIELIELMSVKLNSLLKLVSTTESPIKYTWTFEITEFPITLRGTLSNGRSFILELYKSANWTFKIYINK
ncbi:MAG: hypothetical protein U0T68_06120 [Ferruginibacter sp.]